MTTYGSPENAGILLRSMAEAASDVDGISSCREGSSVEAVVV